MSPAEREQVRAVLNERFADASPATAYYSLLDEGVYLASQSTMYRILRAHGEVGTDRRRQATHPRKHGIDAGTLTMHADRGSSMTSKTLAELIIDLGVAKSHSRPRTSNDNGAAEALNSTLKVEFVHRQHFRTRAEARLKIATWIADFYNVKRRHSANDGLPPVTFERQMIEKRQASTALLRAAVA
ncbi:DDE-type integrase/transposase/recombinase [Nonomuraea turkmeniaca]|uniref:DDE-type integrase/transposase/recombinase n=1 Tax=Nonomuraea turkmeniaca TaxID=103838 RepID=A0A5S4EZW9_9ACTN|nr:DDE-type integrase/transposase/recombinase [Nonomuraea turkmeniaca]